jgi:dTDP-4-dehydrorhamnose 3,5-epimerase
MSNVVIKDTNFEGLKLLERDVFRDERGSFVKNFDFLLKNTFINEPVESYFSRSAKCAIRGLHFQKGAFAQAKLIFCVSGALIDLATDLRRSSKTFGKTFSIKLDSNLGQGIFVPIGFAHGTYSLEEGTEIVVISSAKFSPENEGGVLWSSLEISSSFQNTIVSVKDANLPSIGYYIKTVSACF